MRQTSECEASAVVLAFVAPVGPGPDEGEGGGKAGECAPRSRRERVAGDDTGERIAERPCRQIRRDGGDGRWEPARALPQTAGVRKSEVEEVRDRQRAAGRREIAERDPQERERH